MYFPDFPGIPHLFFFRGEVLSFMVPPALQSIIPGIIKDERQNLPTVFVQNVEEFFTMPAGLKVYLKSGIRELPGSVH